MYPLFCDNELAFFLGTWRVYDHHFALFRPRYSVIARSEPSEMLSKQHRKKQFGDGAGEEGQCREQGTPGQSLASHVWI